MKNTVDSIFAINRLAARLYAMDKEECIIMRYDNYTIELGFNKEKKTADWIKHKDIGFFPRQIRGFANKCPSTQMEEEINNLIKYANETDTVKQEFTLYNSVVNNNRNVVLQPDDFFGDRPF